MLSYSTLLGKQVSPWTVINLPCSLVAAMSQLLPASSSLAVANLIDLIVLDGQHQSVFAVAHQFTLQDVQGDSCI